MFLGRRVVNVKYDKKLSRCNFRFRSRVPANIEISSLTLFPYVLRSLHGPCVSVSLIRNGTPYSFFLLLSLFFFLSPSLPSLSLSLMSLSLS